MVSKGGKFIQDFAAGRITALCFHAGAGWCFQTSHHSPSAWALRCVTFHCGAVAAESICSPCSLPFCPVCALMTSYNLPLRNGSPITIWLLPPDHFMSSWWYYNVNNKMKCRPCLCCWGQGSWIYLQQLKNCSNVFVFLLCLRNLNPPFSVAWKDTA